MFKAIVFGYFLVSCQLAAQDVVYINVGKVAPELNSYKNGKLQLDSIDRLRSRLIDSVYDPAWSCSRNSSKEYWEKLYEDRQAFNVRLNQRDEELASVYTIYSETINENIRDELKEFSSRFCSEKQIEFLVTEEVYYGIKPEDVTEEFIRFICPSDR